MDENKIEPAKITKPIQLLAAWLVGLVLVNGSFLGTAISITRPEWVRGSLIIACIINVPLFLICIFLLQTKFRPEMQEDSYYSKYLETNTGKLVTKSTIESYSHTLRTELLEHTKSNLILISSIDNTVKELASKFASAAITETSSNNPRTQLLQIADKIDTSVKTIDKVMSKSATLPISIEMNDLLPGYEAIRKDLKKSKIAINRTFGSTSQDPEVPKENIISFGDKVPMDKLRTIIEVCSKYGINNISYTYDDMNDGRIYIGSYIYRAKDYPKAVEINEDIKRVLNSPEATLEDLIEEIDFSRA